MPVPLINILVVDDDFLVLAGVIRMLREYRIRPVSHPGYASRAMRDQAPDVVVTDLHLQAGLSGLEVLQAASEVAPNAGRILMSGDPQAELQCWPACVDLFLRKPFDGADLRAAVAHCLRLRRADVVAR